MGARSQIFFLIALSLAIYLGSAFSPPLFDDADSVHAEAAREILERGDWVTLHANGIRYLEKAPFMYWAMAASFKLFGVWEMPARLPLVLGAVAFTLLLYAFGRFSFGPRAGFYAGLAAPTAFGVYLFTRITIPEILLACFITGAHFCFLAARLGPDTRGNQCHPRAGLLYYGMYACIALAVLTKGLIGVIFPAATIGLYLLLARDLRLSTLRDIRLLPGALIFLVIAAPWHLLAGLRNDKFFWFYFMNEHFLRYLGRRVPQDYDKVPLLLFWGLHLVWLFPWTPFVVLAARNLVRDWRDTSTESRVRLFLWVWALLVIAFFSFSTRQEYYTFVAYPAFLLLGAQALAGLEQVPEASLAWSHRVLAMVGVLVAAVLGVMVALSLGTSFDGDIASVLQKNPEYYALSLGHFFDLTPQSFAALRVPAVGAALTLLIGTLVALKLRVSGRHLPANVALALMAACFFLWAHQALNVFGPFMSSKQLAQSIRTSAGPGDRIVISGEYESGSTLNFYTGRQVYILNGRSANLWWGSFYPDAPRIFLDDAGIARIWRQSGRVFLFAETEQLPRLEKLLEKPEVFSRSGGKVVLVNNRVNE